MLLIMTTSRETEPRALAEAATLIGLTMVSAVILLPGRLPGWADAYGTALVYLALVEYMAIAAGLMWWGTETLRRADRATRRSDR